MQVLDCSREAGRACLCHSSKAGHTLDLAERVWLLLFLCASAVGGGCCEHEAGRCPEHCLDGTHRVARTEHHSLL